MPRTLKSSKFYLYKQQKSGYYKDKMLLGVNHGYEGGYKNITLRDLIEFLKEHGLEPSNVPLDSFTGVVIVKPE